MMDLHAWLNDEYRIPVTAAEDDPPAAAKPPMSNDEADPGDRA